MENKILRDEIVEAVRGEFAVFRVEIIDRFEKRFQLIDQRFDRIESRLDSLELEVRGLGVAIEELDDKFTLITEGQDIITDILQHRVGHIEEILGIGAR